MINNIIDFITHSYICSIMLILYGIYSVWKVRRNPQWSEMYLRPDISAWIAGIGFIIVGIMIIIGKLISEN